MVNCVGVCNRGVNDNKCGVGVDGGNDGGNGDGNDGGNDGGNGGGNGGGNDGGNDGGVGFHEDKDREEINDYAISDE